MECRNFNVILSQCYSIPPLLLFNPNISNEKSVKLIIFIGMFGRKCLEENVFNVYNMYILMT